MVQVGHSIRKPGSGSLVFERVLILETSGKVGQAALATGTSLVAELRLGEERRRASDLAMVVDRLLKQQGWRARELTDVVVGLGPGSYTGLRVGLASAKALAFATGCRFHGVDSYAAIATRSSEEARSISVVGDALQGKMFHRRYRRDEGNRLVPVCGFEIIACNEWAASDLSALFVIGPAAGLLQGNPASREFVATPLPVDLLGVAMQLPWAVTNDVWRAEPFYLRGSSAEEKAKNSISAELGPGTAVAGQA